MHNMQPTSPVHPDANKGERRNNSSSTGHMSAPLHTLTNGYSGPWNQDTQATGGHSSKYKHVLLPSGAFSTAQLQPSRRHVKQT